MDDTRSGAVRRTPAPTRGTPATAGPNRLSTPAHPLELATTRRATASTRGVVVTPRLRSHGRANHGGDTSHRRPARRAQLVLPRAAADSRPNQFTRRPRRSREWMSRPALCSVVALATVDVDRPRAGRTAAGRCRPASTSRGTAGDPVRCASGYLEHGHDLTATLCGGLLRSPRGARPPEVNCSRRVRRGRRWGRLMGPRLRAIRSVPQRPRSPLHGSSLRATPLPAHSR